MEGDDLILICRSWHLESDGENFVIKSGLHEHAIATIPKQPEQTFDGDTKSIATLLWRAPKLLECLKETALPIVKMKAMEVRVDQGKEAAFNLDCCVELLNEEIARAEGKAYQQPDWLKQWIRNVGKGEGDVSQDKET